MKEQLHIFMNAAVARIKNRRIAVAKTGDIFQIEFTHFSTENGPTITSKELRNNLTVTSIVLSKEGLSALTEACSAMMPEPEIKLGKLSLRQGTNDAWFIYDGNKVILGGHDKKIVEKVKDMLDSENK